MKIRKFNRLNLILGAAVLCSTLVMTASAGDVDVKLTTNNGSTKFTIQDSGNVEVSSVTSDGNAYFNSVVVATSAGNVILDQAIRQNAELSVTSATFATQAQIGNSYLVGNETAASDNYFAVTLTANGAISAKQLVIMNSTGQVGTTTTANSTAVVGITVSSSAGAGENIRVAVAGMVSGVTCNAAINAGVRVCSTNSAGRVSTCASGTNDAAGIGKMVTTCSNGGTGTLLVDPQ